MKYNEKGSVTMIVVATILFIVILLSSFLVYTSARRRAQIKETEAISKAYDGDMNEIYNEKANDNPVTVEGVIIPTGFYYVGGTKADGIVISDSKEDENKYKEQTEAGNSQIPAYGLVGNQFVWVPVENPDDFQQYDGYSDNEKQNFIGFEPSEEGYRYPNEVEEYNKMCESVDKNHGFYVARYEAGIITYDSPPVSKTNEKVWNNIPWGISMTDIGTNGAVAKAKEMYTDKRKYAVTSTLIYGVQWDAIMAWIDPVYKEPGIYSASNSFVRNSTGKGHYGAQYGGVGITVCGSNDEYRVNNIYDLAGNVAEWTMEASGTTTRVARGGDCYDFGDTAPASNRQDGQNATSEENNDVKYGDSTVGFRVALYL